MTHPLDRLRAVAETALPHGPDGFHRAMFTLIFQPVTVIALLDVIAEQRRALEFINSAIESAYTSDWRNEQSLKVLVYDCADKVKACEARLAALVSPENTDKTKGT